MCSALPKYLKKRRGYPFRGTASASIVFVVYSTIAVCHFATHMLQSEANSFLLRFSALHVMVKRIFSDHESFLPKTVGLLRILFELTEKLFSNVYYSICNKEKNKYLFRLFSKFC